MINGKITAITNEVYDEFFRIGSALSSKISFENYLLNNGFIPLSARLFLKENPLQLIRLTKRNGQTFYKNFEHDDDKGDLLDFIRNRSVRRDEVCPNKQKDTHVSAVVIAQKFLEQNPQRRIKPRVLRQLAMNATKYKI